MEKIKELFDCRMDENDILDVLKGLDAYEVRDWYTTYVSGGSEFEDLACAFCDADENLFLDHVACYISETIDEQEFCNIIMEERWCVELSPRQLALVDDYFGDARFVTCDIQYKDDGTVLHDVIIMLDDEENLDEDDFYTDEGIFFYAGSEDGFCALCDDDNGEDFIILKISGKE